jgi:hypothetical protein
MPLPVQRYQEYADGGAKIEDARLEEMKDKEAMEEAKKRLDEQSFADLFGDGEASTPTSQPAVQVTVKQVPDGKGGWREERTHHFTTQVTPSKSKRQETSLLDN